MLPTAYIVHQARGRVRFRIREKRRDTDYFDWLRDRLDPLGEEVAVRINEAHGSVLFVHPAISYADLAAMLQELDVFVITEGSEPGAHALTPLLSLIAKLDRALLSGTSGSVDLRTLIFVAALLAVIHQLRRGEVFSPAFPMLWSALDMVSRYVSKNAANST